MRRRNSVVSIPQSLDSPSPSPSKLTQEPPPTSIHSNDNTLIDPLLPPQQNTNLHPDPQSDSSSTQQLTLGPLSSVNAVSPKPASPPDDSHSTHISEILARTSQHRPLSPSSTPSPVQEQLQLDEDRISKMPSGTPKEIIDSLRGFLLFKTAPESFLQAIASKLVTQVHPAHSFIITEGEEARAMYWIIRGTVGIVSRDGESVHAKLGPGAFFGEIGILFDCPRTASVQAREKCVLAVLTAGALNEVLPAYPVIEQAIRDEAQERLAVLKKTRLAKRAKAQESSDPKGNLTTPKRLPPIVPDSSSLPLEPSPQSSKSGTPKHSIGDLSKYLEHTGVREILGEMPLFNKLPSTILHKLALAIEPKAYGPFQMVIRQNTPGKDIYFIIDGQVEVLDETSQTVIARLSRGAYFGEMAFLSWADKRTASVRTITEVDCLVVTEHTLLSICRDYPDFQSHIEETANLRIGNNQSQRIWQRGDVGSSRYLSKRNSISDHSSSIREEGDKKDGPQGNRLDHDPFHVKKSKSENDDENDSHQNKKEDHGVGLFSKSWNTSGSFGSPSHSNVLRPPVHELGPHEPESTESNSSPTSRLEKSSAVDPLSPITDIQLSQSLKALPEPKISSLPSYDTSLTFPNYNISNEPTYTNPLYHTSSESQPLPPAPSFNPPSRPASSKPFPLLYSGIPESIPEEEETGNGGLFTSDPPTSDSINTISPNNKVIGMRRHLSHGLLLHPRAKRVRQFSRRRSSLFNIGPFPDFIQIKIFQYLDLKSLMAMQRVCQHWRQVLQTSQQLLRDLDLRQYNTTVNDTSIISITNFAGLRPKRVDISNCFHLTDEGFSFLVNGIGLAKIHVFKMKSVWEVSGMAIMDLTVPSIGSDLEEIDLSNCRKVGDSTLTRLIGWVIPPFGPDGKPNISPAPGTVVGCAKLRRISLSYCKHITDRSMYHLAMFASDRIEYLDLTRCTTITDHGFSFWTLRSFTVLTHLCLADCTFLTDKAIIAIASAAKGLKSLVLSFCCALTDVSVEVLSLGCPALEVLDLAYCGSAVSDASLSTVALHLLELQSLSVRGCVRVTRTGVDTMLMVAGSHKLRFLDITQCQNTQRPVPEPIDMNTGQVRVIIKQ